MIRFRRYGSIVCAVLLSSASIGPVSAEGVTHAISKAATLQIESGALRFSDGATVQAAQGDRFVISEGATLEVVGDGQLKVLGSGAVQIEEQSYKVDDDDIVAVKQVGELKVLQGSALEFEIPTSPIPDLSSPEPTGIQPFRCPPVGRSKDQNPCDIAPSLL